MGMGGGGEDESEQKEEILYGGKRVTQWPYDDYHAIQQLHYVKVEEIAITTNAQEENIKVSNTQNLQRPPDPPDVPTAVMGLPLSNFESKAEDRAIAIVSTWLFDCGLIDELLVHGGMGVGSSLINNANNNNNVDD
jgi:hypothetical protein